MLCKFLLATVAFAVTLSSPVAAHHTDKEYQLLPANPRPMEDVRLRIDAERPDCLYEAAISMSGNRIKVAIHSASDFLCFGIRDYDLGKFPAGTYFVDVYYRNGSDLRWTETFTIPSVQPPRGQFQVNYTGVWWSPDSPGWGLSIFHQPNDLLYAGWHDYDTDGQPTWFAFVGARTNSDNRFIGDIVRASAPTPASPPFVVSTERTVVGRAYLFFYPDHSIGLFYAEFNGVIPLARYIQRYPFED